MPRTYYVYILASRSRRLYTGVTNDLHRRLREHREGSTGSFTTRYHIDRLVYFESTSDVRAAIAREKEIKAWSRQKRIRLIEEQNAGWLDLAADWSGSGSG
jgi:putative endonuclease